VVRDAAAQSAGARVDGSAMRLEGQDPSHRVIVLAELARQLPETYVDVLLATARALTRLEDDTRAKGSQ
jgi:hypothetical protein